MSAPQCVLVFTQSSKLLVNCAVGSYAQRPTLDVLPLCQLLSTMQALAGRPPAGFVELHGMRVLLLEGYSVVVAVMCDSSCCSTDSARLLGMQVLNVFGKLFHRDVEALGEEHEHAQSAAVTSYTFHSSTRSSDGGGVMAGGDGSSTMPDFLAFQQSYLLPLLLRPPAEELWLQPMLRPAAALRAVLLRPSASSAPATPEDGVLLATTPRAGRPLAQCTGPQVPPLWAAVLSEGLAMIRLLGTATSTATSTAMSTAMSTGTEGGGEPPHTRLALLAFPELRDGASCLHAAFRAARVMPGGAALVLFYTAALPRDASTGTSAGAPASAVSLADALVPADVRAALGDAARAIAAAFPAAVTNLSDATALVAPGTPYRLPALAEGKLAAVPDLPIRGAGGEDGSSMSPLQLDIESPRLGDLPTASARRELLPGEERELGSDS